MNVTTPIKAVLFDAAGVLTGPFSFDLVEGALAAGADPIVLAEILYPIFASAGTGDSIGNQLERGEVTLDAFFANFGDHEADLRLVIDPAAATFFGRTWQPNAAMHSFVHEVHAAGFATALVSNNVREWQETWDRLTPASLPFDTRLFSWQLGMRKPEPRMYQAALAALGVEAHEALFIDDFEAMVDGARSVGMRAVHFADADQAIAEARKILAI